MCTMPPSAGKALYNMLQPSNGSYYCTPIFNTNKSSENALPLLGLNFVFIKGKNLQDTVYFGDAFNNVDNIMYTLDESAEKPLYHILQEVPGDSWNEGTVADMVSGEWKYWLEDWLRVDGNRPDDMGFCFPEQVFFSQVDGYELIPENEAKIRNQMKLQAQLDMLNRYKVESIEVSVLQNRFYYLKDYDLGDVCSVSIDEIQQMFTARIVEVKEVHSDNKVDVEIVLGTPQKTQWKKVL